MKKSAIALLLILVACGAFPLDFRKTSWLMSSADVIASETGLVATQHSLSNQQQLEYKTAVEGFTATITYLLVDDKLLSASYTFAKDVKRSAYDAMKQALTGVYGAPAVNKDGLLGWRLAKTEIALAHLDDGTTQVSYWEKSYFARINNLQANGSGKN